MFGLPLESFVCLSRQTGRTGGCSVGVHSRLTEPEPGSERECPHKVDACKCVQQSCLLRQKSPQSRSCEQRSQKRKGYNQVTGTGEKARHGQRNATNSAQEHLPFVFLGSVARSLWE